MFCEVLSATLRYSKEMESLYTEMGNIIWSCHSDPYLSYLVFGRLSVLYVKSSETSAGLQSCSHCWPGLILWSRGLLLQQLHWSVSRHNSNCWLWPIQLRPRVSEGLCASLWIRPGSEIFGEPPLSPAIFTGTLGLDVGSAFLVAARKHWNSLPKVARLTPSLKWAFLSASL